MESQLKSLLLVEPSSETAGDIIRELRDAGFSLDYRSNWNAAFYLICGDEVNLDASVIRFPLGQLQRKNAIELLNGLNELKIPTVVFCTAREDEFRTRANLDFEPLYIKCPPEEPQEFARAVNKVTGKTE